MQDNFLVAYNKYLLNHCECCKEWRVKYTDLEKKEIKNSFDESFLNNSNYYNLSSNIVLDNLISDDLIKNGNYVDVPILHPEISINTSIFDDKLYEISNIVKKKENCEKLKCLNLENEHVHNTFDMDTVECKMQNDKIISEIIRPHDDFDPEKHFYYDGVCLTHDVLCSDGMECFSENHIWPDCPYTITSNLIKTRSNYCTDEKKKKSYISPSTDKIQAYETWKYKTIDNFNHSCVRQHPDQQPYNSNIPLGIYCSQDCVYSDWDPPGCTVAQKYDRTSNIPQSRSILKHYIGEDGIFNETNSIKNHCTSTSQYISCNWGTDCSCSDYSKECVDIIATNSSSRGYKKTYRIGTRCDNTCKLEDGTQILDGQVVYPTYRSEECNSSCTLDNWTVTEKVDPTCDDDGYMIETRRITQQPQGDGALCPTSLTRNTPIPRALCEHVVAAAVEQSAPAQAAEQAASTQSAEQAAEQAASTRAAERAASTQAAEQARAQAAERAAERAAEQARAQAVEQARAQAAERAAEQARAQAAERAAEQARAQAAEQPASTTDKALELLKERNIVLDEAELKAFTKALIDAPTPEVAKLKYKISILDNEDWDYDCNDVCDNKDNLAKVKIKHIANVIKGISSYTYLFVTINDHFKDQLATKFTIPYYYNDGATANTKILCWKPSPAFENSNGYCHADMKNGNKMIIIGGQGRITKIHEMQECDCDVDCVQYEWFNYGPCECDDNGFSTQTKTRRIGIHPRGNGTPCEPPKIVQPCEHDIKVCSVVKDKDFYTCKENIETGIFEINNNKLPNGLISHHFTSHPIYKNHKNDRFIKQTQWYHYYDNGSHTYNREGNYRWGGGNNPPSCN